MTSKDIIRKCPWSKQEHLIQKIKNSKDIETQENTFEKLFITMNDDSNFENFWLDIYNTMIEHHKLLNKHKHLLSEFSKLDDENERLHSIIDNS
jgi:hypothetical protein